MRTLAVAFALICTSSVALADDGATTDPTNVEVGKSDLKNPFDAEATVAQSVKAESARPATLDVEKSDLK